MTDQTRRSTSDQAARPLPTGTTGVTEGRLLHRARNGTAEERRAAQVELDRRRAARTTGGAA